MEQAERKYGHHMLREIAEQPEARRRTLAAFTAVRDGKLTLREGGFAAAVAGLAVRESLVIAASGSSRHAGLVAEVLLEEIAGLPVDVEYASEYIYRAPRTVGEPAFLVLAQSGDTADRLQALPGWGAQAADVCDYESIRRTRRWGAWRVAR